jgi:hypothetical protein
MGSFPIALKNRDSLNATLSPADILNDPFQDRHYQSSLMFPNGDVSGGGMC